MIRLSGLTLDQVNHPVCGPQSGAIAQCFRACLQAAADLLQLGSLQARFAARSTGAFEGLGSVFVPGLVPAIDRLAMNAQLSPHLGLANALIEESGGFHTPLFQLRELFRVAPHAFWVAHAQRLA